MASGAAFQRKISNLLGRLQATARVVKLRRVTIEGGNARLGIGGTATVVDTVVDPQPAVEMIEPPLTDIRADNLSTAGGMYQPVDYRFTFAGSLAEADLRTQLIVYGDVVMKPREIVPNPFMGTIITWTVIATPIKPAD